MDNSEIKLQYVECNNESAQQGLLDSTFDIILIRKYRLAVRFPISLQKDALIKVESLTKPYEFYAKCFCFSKIEFNFNIFSLT